MIVYHGSIVTVSEPLVNVGRRNLDFGPGFYVTDLEEQAISWASRPLNAGKPHILNIYEFEKEALLQSERQILVFDSYSEEWLDFVIGNRSGRELWKGFDLVEGGIANDRIFNTIELYSSNLISKEETLQRLQYEKPNNQICILSQAVADTYLHFVESSVIVTEEPTR